MFKSKHTLTVPSNILDEVSALCWSPSGDALVTAAGHREPARVRAYATDRLNRYGRPALLFQYAPKERASHVQFSPDGDEMLCASLDGSIKIFGKRQ